MRHNKKRNSALLYEFLVRHISKCLVGEDKSVAKSALAISKKHFAVGTPLHEELALFRSVLDTRVNSRHSAQKIIEAVRRQAAKTNVRTLDVAKSKVIKDINHTLKERTFYDYKIPDYVVYASAQTILNEARNKKPTLSEVQRITLEDVLCEHMVTSREQDLSPLSPNPDYNSTVYGLVVEKFHKKYDQKLSVEQKGLLTKYAAFLISGDAQPMKASLQEQAKRVTAGLRTVKDPAIKEDADLMDKIMTCYKKTLALEIQDINDEVVLEILRYMQLLDEVNS